MDTCPVRSQQHRQHQRHLRRARLLPLVAVLLLTVVGLAASPASATVATAPRTALASMGDETAAAPATGGLFGPLTPRRLLDTRSGVGAPVGRVAAGSTLALQVAGRGGVPSTGVAAVVL